MSARLVVLSVLLLGGMACTFSPGVPAEATVTCSRDSQCPARTSCDPVLGICRSLENDLLDSPAVWPALVTPGSELHAVFALTRETRGPPQVVMATRDGRRWPMSPAGERAGRRVFTATVDGSAPEGDVVVLVSLVDTLGTTYSGLKVGASSVDDTPPRIDGVAVKLLPEATNPLVLAGRGDRLEAATVGTIVDVEVTTSGSTQLPVVRAVAAGGTEVAFEPVGGQPGSTHFRWTVPATPVSQGAWQVSVLLKDDAGHQVSHTQPNAFDVDTEPPPEAGSSEPGRVVIEHAPTGTLEHPGVPQWSLQVRRGEGARNVLQLFAGEFLLLTVDTDATGALPGTPLPLRTDTTDLRLRVIDLAGNASRKTLVRDVEWVNLASRGSGLTAHGSEVDQPCIELNQLAPYALGAPLSGGWRNEPRRDGTLLPPSPKTVVYWDTWAQELVAMTSSLRLGAVETAQYRWVGGGWGPPFGGFQAPYSIEALAYNSTNGTLVTAWSVFTPYVASAISEVNPANIDYWYQFVSSCREPGRPYDLVYTRFDTAAGLGMAFDARRSKTVAFGGRVPYPTANYRDTTVEVVRGVAQERLTQPRPQARGEHAMAYDPTRDVVVLFGGLNNAKETLGDTWLYDGTNWRTGPTGPPPRAHATMAWDPVEKVVVLAGGESKGAVLGDVWEFDGLQWRQRGTIPPRANAGLAWHPLERKWFWAGGYVRGTDGGTQGLTDTYRSLTDGGWELPAAPATVVGPIGQSAPVGGPFFYTPTSATFAYDSQTHQGFAFHGRSLTTEYCSDTCSDPFNSYFNDLYTWGDPATAGYHLLAVDGGRPSPRSDGALAMQPDGGLMLVGGRTDTTVMGDTWLFAGGAWTQLDASVAPRSNALLAWSHDLQAPVLHGGVTSDGGVSGDTFELRPNGWQLTGTGLPAQTLDPAASLVWVPSKGLVLAVPKAPGLAVYQSGAWRSEPQSDALSDATQSVCWLGARRELISTGASSDAGTPQWSVVTDGVRATEHLPTGAFFGSEPASLVAPNLLGRTDWHTGDVRPSIEFSVDVNNLPPGAELSFLAMKVKGGGLGFVDGGLTPGIELSLFGREGYLTGGGGARNAAPTEAPDVTEWVITDTGLLRLLLNHSGAIRLRVTPVGRNELKKATVLVEEAEARWGARLLDSRDAG